VNNAQRILQINSRSSSLLALSDVLYLYFPKKVCQDTVKTRTVIMSRVSTKPNTFQLKGLGYLNFLKSIQAGQ